MKTIIRNSIIIIGVGVGMFFAGNLIVIGTKEREVVWSEVKFYDDLNFDHIEKIRTVKTLCSGRSTTFIIIYGRIIVPGDKKLIKIPIHNQKDVQDLLAGYFAIEEKVDLGNVAQFSSCYVYLSHGIFALVSEDKSLVFFEMKREPISGAVK